MINHAGMTRMDRKAIFEESEKMMTIVRASPDLDAWCNNMEAASKHCLRRFTLLHSRGVDDPWYIKRSSIIDEVEFKVYLKTEFTCTDHYYNSAIVGYHMAHPNVHQLAKLRDFGGNFFNGSGVNPDYAFGGKGINHATGIWKYAQSATIDFDELPVMKKEYGELITMLRMQGDDDVIKFARAPSLNGIVLSIWD